MKNNTLYCLFLKSLSSWQNLKWVILEKTVVTKTFIHFILECFPAFGPLITSVDSVAALM